MCFLDNGCVPYLLLVPKLFSMAGPPDNIPLGAREYLESGIVIITTLTLTCTLILKRTLTQKRTLILTRTLNRTLTLTLTLTLTITHMPWSNTIQGKFGISQLGNASPPTEQWDECISRALSKASSPNWKLKCTEPEQVAPRTRAPQGAGCLVPDCSPG